MTEFWAAAAVVVAVLTIPITVFFTWRVANPKRQFLWTVPMSFPLLAVKLPDIEIFNAGTKLIDPYLVVLRVACRGTHDIANHDFNNNDPITIDVGAQILSIDGPDRTRFVNWQHDRTRLHIGPSLIRKNTETNFILMTEGKPNPTIALNPLINISIINREPILPELGQKGGIARRMVTGGIVILLPQMLMFSYTAIADDPNRIITAFGSAAVIVGMLVGLYLFGTSAARVTKEFR